MGYNQTQFKHVHVANKVSDKMHDLSGGYAECQGLYVSGTTTITGATTCLSTLGVTGAATLSSTLAITGNATLSGFLIGGSSITGSYSFQGTGTSTGVTVAGMTASDHVFAIPRNAVTVNDVLATSAYSGGFNVIRPNTSGTSGLLFDYFVVRPAS